MQVTLTLISALNKQINAYIMFIISFALHYVKTKFMIANKTVHFSPLLFYLHV